MKKILLLLGLVGCVPQTPMVEVPTVIQIPQAPKPVIAEVEPVHHIQWTVERGDQEIEREIVSPYIFVFKRDGLVVTTSLENSILTIECSSGSKVNSYCQATPGRFTFVCDGNAIYPLVLKLSCTIETDKGE